MCNGKFNLTKDEVEKFITILKEADKELLINKEGIKARWWKEKKIKENIENNNFVIGEKNNIIYAVDKKGVVYYWIK